MTATDELRRLLDERGVEWEDMSARLPTGMLWCTEWTSQDGEPCTAIEGADDIPDGKLSVQALLTPAQAIAATLGDTDATRERQGDAGTCRPCPFCGSNAETVHTLNVMPHEPWWIRCPSCGVTTPKYSSETDAIAAWNRRAQ